MRMTALLLMLSCGLVACDDALLPEGEPAPVEPVEPPSCIEVCEGCDDGTCVSQCETLQGVLDPRQKAAWSTCLAVDACNPDQARACLDGLDCEDDQLIADHCDTVARCGMDGRGQLDEEACRNNPYHEATRWTCLAEDRRAAVSDCLVGERCISLTQCLDNAICQGEASCASMMATSLTVDCHRVCHRSLMECGDGGNRYGHCWRQCDRAARALADDHRRTFENCALTTDCNGQTLADQCIGALECDRAPLQAKVDAAADRCGRSLDAQVPVAEWACIGHVMQSAVGTCLETAECGEVDACITRATTCADDPGCLDFFDDAPRW